MLIIYKIVLNLAYVLIWPYLIYKRLRGRREWSQRRAINPESYLPTAADSSSREAKTAPLLWGHASSMGEVRVLARLFEAVQRLRPEIRFCVSTYTRTGQSLARELFPGAEGIFYFPIDAYFPLRRFFKQFRPDGIVMVETEIWPYFLDFCRRLNVPLILANGRLSAGSTNGYRKFRRYLLPLLDVYRKFAVQSEIDAGRIISIGADPDRVIVTGNIKHDPDPKADFSAKRRDARARLNLGPDRLLFIAASTRPGEEEIVGRAIRGIDDFENKLTTIVAPRHLERLEDVKTILDMNRLRYILYSEIMPGTALDAAVILMDKMGLLADLFYGADLAFVGGTLVDLGGHNIMEPPLAGTPVLFGPSVFNVSEAAEIIAGRKLGKIVKNENELTEAMAEFVDGKLNFERIDLDCVAGGELSVSGKTAKMIVEEMEL